MIFACVTCTSKSNEFGSFLHILSDQNNNNLCEENHSTYFTLPFLFLNIMPWELHLHSYYLYIVSWSCLVEIMSFLEEKIR